MKLTIHTERGSYTSKSIDLTEDQRKDLQELIEQSAERGDYFKLETESGYVVLGKDLLRAAVFVVDA